MSTTRILLVCMGNICRSPMAEGLVRHKAHALGLDISTDSAGTIDHHAGEAPDPRAQRCMEQHGITIGDLRARRILPEDFRSFDLLLAMDQSNLDGMLRLAPAPALAHKARLMMTYAPDLPVEVPDPWYGGPEDFEQAFRLLDRATDNLMDTLRSGR